MVDTETLQHLFEEHSTSYLMKVEVYSCRAWELEHVTTQSSSGQLEFPPYFVTFPSDLGIHAQTYRQ